MVLLLIPIICFANFPNLARELILVNKELWKFHTQISREKIQRDLLVANKELAMNAQIMSKRDNKDSAFSFLSPKINTKLLHIGAKKEFFTGTHLILEHQYTSISSLDLQEAKWKIRVQQDLGINLLGRKSKSDLKIQEKAIVVAGKQRDHQKDLLLMKFYQNYLMAQKTKALIEWQKELLKRAQRRKSDVIKLVKDNLREKMDLYKSEGSALGQDQKLNVLETQYQDNLKTLSLQIHREVQQNEISTLLPRDERIENGKSKAVDYLASEISLKEEKLEQIKFGYTPKIEFFAEYLGNRVVQQDVYLESIKDPREVRSVGISFNWPWSYESVRLNRAKGKVSLLHKNIDYQRTLNNFQSEKTFLLRQLEIHKKNHLLGTKRLLFARKALDEANRLYRQGRLSLDLLLRTEEEWISSHVGNVEQLYSWQLHLARYWQITGHLEKNLLGD